MFRSLPSVVLSCLSVVSPVAAEEVRTINPPRTIGEIERLDPALDELLEPGVEIEHLASGFMWSEGPLWIADGEFLIFSDIPRNSIFKYQDGEGVSLFIKPAGYTGEIGRGGESGSNGLALNADSELVLCQHGDARVAKLTSPLGKKPPEYVTLVGEYQGKQFNSPNDLAIHSSGAIYFTDPPYGREGAFDAERPLDFQGVYRLSPEGELTLLTKKLHAPNGIAFSPDEKTLYVAQSWGEAPVYMAYNVQADGGIDQGRVLFDASELAKTRQGAPDGLKVDQHGNLFATGPGGVLVLTPEGKHLGTILTGERTANCCFGDDGATLYMTAHGKLCRIRTKTRGAGF